jgi:rod shape-determining protein MreC
VVTAGIDGVYPPDLAVGRVTKVERTGPAYRRVLIEPFADFSRLETVLVLLAPTAVPAGPLAAPQGQVAR